MRNFLQSQFETVMFSRLFFDENADLARELDVELSLIESIWLKEEGAQLSDEKYEELLDLLRPLLEEEVKNWNGISVFYFKLMLEYYVDLGGNLKRFLWKLTLDHNIGQLYESIGDDEDVTYYYLKDQQGNILRWDELNGLDLKEGKISAVN